MFYLILYKRIKEVKSGEKLLEDFWNCNLVNKNQEGKSQ